MSSVKTKRATRQDPGGRRATVRDSLGLRFIAQVQPVTTGQYARLLGISRAVAWRSLRKLRDLGLVNVHVERLESENRYALAPAGARELARQLGRAPEDFTILRSLGRVSDHHATIVDAFVCLQLALSRSKEMALERVAFEAELRRRVGPTKDALVPDAVIVVRFPNGSLSAFAVEVDLGNENPSYLARQKFIPYGALAAARQPLLDVRAWSVLVLVPTQRRLNTLARAAWDAEVPEGLISFAVSGELDDRQVLGETWHTPRLDADGQGASIRNTSPFAYARANGCAS